MRELDNNNALDVSAKAKIRDFLATPNRITITRTAERDAALLRITRLGVIEAILCHVQVGKAIYFERMDSGELAYIMKECASGGPPLYVKVKFYVGADETEKMLIISAHPDRRW